MEVRSLPPELDRAERLGLDRMRDAIGRSRAVVLAAGEGTRMRSARPKPLHLLCGRAMLLYVLDALAELPGRPGRRRRRPRRRAGHQEAPGRGARPACSTSSSSTCSGAPATPSAVGAHRASPTTPTPTTATCSSCPATRRCCGRRPSPRWCSAHREPDAACTVLTARARRPDRLRPGRAGQGRPGRRASSSSADATRRGARDRRDQHVDLLLPPQRAGARRCAGCSPENAQGEYYLTDVVGGAARRRLPGRRRRGRRRRRDRRASTTACSWPRPRPSCGGAPTTRWLRAGRHDGRPRAAPTSTPPSQLAPDVTLFPGTILQGAHGRRRAAPRSAPTPAWSTASSARTPSSSRPTGRDAEIGAGAVVGPFAVLEPGRVDRRTGRSPGRSTLPPGPTSGRRRRDRGRRTHGAGHQEEAAAVLRRLPPGAGRGDRRAPRRRARRAEPAARSPTARSHCRFGESIRGADVFIIQTHCEPGERRDHGAADHDRRRQAGVGQAHHRRLPLLRLRPPGPQGRGPRADHGQAGRRHAHRRPAPTGSCRSTCTPARSRASSTGRSTTSPPCRCWSTTCSDQAGERRRGRVARRRPGEGGRALLASSSAPTWPSSTSAGPRAGPDTVEARDVIGDVEGRRCVLIDDMIDTAGTIVAAADILMEHGATDVWAMATHGVLSDPAIDRLKNSVDQPGRRHQHAAAPVREADRQARGALGGRSSPTPSTPCSRTPSVSEIFGGENQS